MLKVLRRIVQEINGASDLSEALQMLVHRIREAMHTRSCSVFLADNTKREYVLVATDGLNPHAVGRTRLQFGQGLVGLVGQQAEPLNLKDAPTHPHFHYFPDIGEERYKAFLGVPIIHNRILFGVLVVQQEQRRRFTEAEETMLVTLSAQLGGVIAHAKATGMVTNLLKGNYVGAVHDITFTGLASSGGIGMGSAVVVYPRASLDAVPRREIKDTEQECKRLKTALQATRKDIGALRDQLAQTIPPEELALFDAYLKILDSKSLQAEMLKEIELNNWAEGALSNVIKCHVRKFETMEDDYLRARATDIVDLGQRVLMHLQAEQHARTGLVYPAQTVLVGEEISASAIAEVPKDQLVGVVSIRGSKNSHASILARAIGIPMISGVENLPVTQLEDQEILLDGFQGNVYLKPSRKLQKTFNNLITQQKALTASLEELRNLPAKTLDGHHIPLWVNTGLAADANFSLTAGAEGVGLYRTEIPFMSRERFPGEEEQYAIYHQLLKTFAPRPVVMRTLDIGGDKSLPYFPVQEDNPFLGWRGIRITLDHPEIFLMQLRAMLRANNNFNNLQIMLPMITSLHEMEEALALIHRAYQEVSKEDAGIKKPPLGVMIEVPSAVYQARALAAQVDFLSIGSNDLTQYLLAVDRNNARVAGLYDGLHPAVLHALHHVVESAHAVNKPVSICGEMASDPLVIPLLLAMGFDALSMNAAAIPRAKWVIRHFSLTQARHLLKEVLDLHHVRAVREHMEQALREAGLEQLLQQS